MTDANFSVADPTVGGTVETGPESGGVTAPRGFRASGVTAGIKASGNPDMALIVNDGPTKTAAAVFTRNRVQAAPVTVTRDHVADGALTAVLLNSGNANACNGRPGVEDALASCAALSDEFGVPITDIGVCSTGLIGDRLPMDTILGGIAPLVGALTAEPAGATAAATAIMTTDLVDKQAVFRGDGFTVGAMGKGVGMISPSMATMLGVLTTDADVTPEMAHAAIAAASEETFNRLDIDGSTSTNDTVLLLASGASGVTPDPDEFGAAVTRVCADLARQMVGDAEGAQHDIAVRVVNAETEQAAEAVARAVARSNLFKTAVFGQDPNWGRVISAVGTVPESVAAFDATALDVSFNGVQVCRASGVGEDRSLVDLSAREVRVEIDLHAGDVEATIWTNDLTHDYVHENSAYST